MRNVLHLQTQISPDITHTYRMLRIEKIVNSRNVRKADAGYMDVQYGEGFVDFLGLEEKNRIEGMGL